MANLTKITAEDITSFEPMRSGSGTSARVKGATVISSCVSREEFLEKWNSGSYKSQLNKSGNSYSLLEDNGDLDVAFWKQNTTEKKTLVERLGLNAKALAAAGDF